MTTPTTPLHPVATTQAGEAMQYMLNLAPDVIRALKNTDRQPLADLMTAGVGMIEAALAAIEMQASHSAAADAVPVAEWIDIKEFSPKDGETVIILFWPYDNPENKQIVGQAEYYDGGFYNEDGDDHHYPSHWMPMPAAPTITATEPQ